MGWEGLKGLKESNADMGVVRYAQYCRMSSSADGRIKRDLARTMPRNEFFRCYSEHA